MFRTDDVPEEPTLELIWEDEGAVQGQDLDLRRLDLHRRRRPLPQGDAARLGIDNPYMLNDEQFTAAVDLLKKQAPNVGEYWPATSRSRSSRSRTATASSARRGRTSTSSSPARTAGAGQGDQAQGGHDRLVGHWMIDSKAAEPELHVPLDEPHDLTERRQRWRGLQRGAGQPEGVRADEEQEPLRRLPRRRRAWWEDVYYWTTPSRTAPTTTTRRRARPEDWKTAWTEIRG